MGSVNPGKLDRRITLQKRVMTRDATGSRVETWTDESSVCAEYVIAKGGESTIAEADRSTTSQQFRIRNRILNSTDYRILYKSRFYNITGIIEEGRKTSLLLDTVTTQSLT